MRYDNEHDNEKPLATPRNEGFSRAAKWNDNGQIKSNRDRKWRRAEGDRVGRGRGESITRQGINQSTEINDKLGDSPPKVLLPSPFLSPVPSSRCSLPLHSHSVLHSPTPYLSFALAPYLLSGRYHQVPTKCSSTDNYKQINSMCAAMRRCPPYASTPLHPYTPTPLS